MELLQYIEKTKGIGDKERERKKSYLWMQDSWEGREVWNLEQAERVLA